MKRLDACPFCGIQDQLDLVRDDSRNGWIHCFSCGANGPTLRTLADDTVADAWNGRASQPLEKRPLTN
ncbi:Lar family restriction alleviation protein [Bradyrhizobium sp. 186]|nr:Lar family restriction alleviation protein [Bradyrhizobium sp. 186]